MSECCGGWEANADMEIAYAKLQAENERLRFENETVREAISAASNDLARLRRIEEAAQRALLYFEAHAPDGGDVVQYHERDLRAALADQPIKEKA